MEYIRSIGLAVSGDLDGRRLSSARRNAPVLVINAEYGPLREKYEFYAGKLRTAH